MFKFDCLEKSLGIVSPPHFVYYFSRKMFLVLHSINWPNFIAWLPLLREILGNISIAIVCKTSCDVINFEIYLIFPTMPFLNITKKPRQKFDENEQRFQGEIESTFHAFKKAFSCQKLSQTWEGAFKDLFGKLQKMNILRLQSFTKYLRQTLVFMWNNKIRESFNFHFSAVLCQYQQNFCFGRKNGHQIIILWSFEILLVFLNFLRS